MEELRPCPRCGGEAAIATVRYNKDFAEKEGWGQSEFYYVNCTRFACGVETRGTGGLKTPESAAKDWNTRPIEDALRAENARLKERCEAYKELMEALEEYNKTESDNLYARIPGSLGLGLANKEELFRLQTAHDRSMNQLKAARAKLAALEEQPCP